ncbi:23S rRNA (guanosine(2251)-2'-O)-methyltransferase RlmB [Spiroplasma endosymbiont of Crioceris asparagi]|uniref:23S rRNA (guanosine(2251)-2'-O)-methyltransferase RlmB n=1 Tax=Spiroplasma endosymbiont of Crioceris asparagi TaxID=3066286 RepID=UPI0030CCFBE0
MKDYIFGRKAVLNVIKNYPNIIQKIIIQDNLKLDKYEETILNNKYNLIEYLSKFDIEKKAQGLNHQGFLCILKEYKYTHFSEITKNGWNTILCLDSIQDPQNFGAIIRSAVLLGVDAIIILDHNQAMVNGTVFKTSAGTANDIPIVKVSNLSNALEHLKKSGYWIYASALNEQSQDIKDISFSEKKVIIIGNEGKGVSMKLLKNSDFIFKINTKTNIDSLNVSVAAGIILYECSKSNR